MIAKEELEKKTIKELRYLLADGYHKKEYNLILAEYQSRDDTKAKIKEQYRKKHYSRSM